MFCLILIRNYSDGMSAKSMGVILSELPQLLNESDLHIAQLTMDLMTSISRSGLKLNFVMLAFHINFFDLSGGPINDPLCGGYALSFIPCNPLVSVLDS